MVLHLRYWQIQHVRSSHVRYLLINGNQFRDVEEVSKAGTLPVSGTFRGKLDALYRFTEGRCPGIKRAEAHFLQKIVLQVPLCGIQLCHGVGKRCAGGMDVTHIVGNFINITALHEQIGCFLGVGLGNAGHVMHLRVEEQILELVALIHEKSINAQFLEGNDIVTLLAVLELFQLRLKALLGALHLLDGKGIFVLIKRRNGLGNILDLTP